MRRVVALIWMVVGATQAQYEHLLLADSDDVFMLEPLGASGLRSWQDLKSFKNIFLGTLGMLNNTKVNATKAVKNDLDSDKKAIHSKFEKIKNEGKKFDSFTVDKTKSIYDDIVHKKKSLSNDFATNKHKFVDNIDKHENSWHNKIKEKLGVRNDNIVDYLAMVKRNIDDDVKKEKKRMLLKHIQRVLLALEDD